MAGEIVTFTTEVVHKVLSGHWLGAKESFLKSWKTCETKYVITGGKLTVVIIDQCRADS
jgi:hypothetical protein